MIVVSETSRVDVEAAFDICRRSASAPSTTASIPTRSGRCRASSVSRTSCCTSATREDRNKGARYFLEAINLLKDELDFRVTFVDNQK